jgi:hypothetical protein
MLVRSDWPPDVLERARLSVRGRRTRARSTIDFDRTDDTFRLQGNDGALLRCEAMRRVLLFRFRIDEGNADVSQSYMAAISQGLRRRGDARERRG